MTNAKHELLKVTENTSRIKCAEIMFGNYEYKDVVGEGVIKVFDNKAILKINYTEQDLSEFIRKLNFKYDSGYGGQYLYGNVWLDDGTWLERGEYDGMEWWEHKVCPQISKNCIN